MEKDQKSGFLPLEHLRQEEEPLGGNLSRHACIYDPPPDQAFQDRRITLRRRGPLYARPLRRMQRR
jgi:hypothetical protein